MLQPLAVLSLLAALGAAAPAITEQAPLAGDYVVVAVREASGVAHGPDTGPERTRLIGRRVAVGGAGRWIDGQTCQAHIRPATTPWPYGPDPNLSDLRVAAQPDRSLDTAWVLDCGGRARSAIVPLLRIDRRVVVAAVGNSERFAILERPLAPETALRIESALRDAGFEPGPADGVIDPAARRAIGAFAHAHGAAYAFADGVLTENLEALILSAGASAAHR